MSLVTEKPETMTPLGWRVAVVRIVVAIVVGMMSLFALAESIEFLAVQLAAGKWTTDPVEYFAVRNRPYMLGAKFVYQSAATIAAGYLAAWAAGRGREMIAGLAAGIIQAAMFIVALTTPEMRQTAPDWVWFGLMVITVIGFYIGARLRAHGTPIAKRLATLD